MPQIRRLMTRRTALRLAIVSMVVVAAACSPFDSCFGSTPTVTFTPTPTAAATTAATKAATTAATVVPAATTVAASTTFSGTAKLGVDHPPFLMTYPAGGKSYVLFCGSITGANGGSVAATLSGGTGQPGNVTGPIGADGKFLIPVPIQQFGPIMATNLTVKNAAGATLTGAIQIAPLTVDAADVVCTP